MLDHLSLTFSRDPECSTTCGHAGVIADFCWASQTRLPSETASGVTPSAQSGCGFLLAARKRSGFEGTDRRRLPATQRGSRRWTVTVRRVTPANSVGERLGPGLAARWLSVGEWL
jgi:hypothetical protein